MEPKSSFFPGLSPRLVAWWEKVHANIGLLTQLKYEQNLYAPETTVQYSASASASVA